MRNHKKLRGYCTMQVPFYVLSVFVARVQQQHAFWAM